MSDRATIHKEEQKKRTSESDAFRGSLLWCRERDSNPHSHYWPRDFKSLVSTNSTIAAPRAENGTRTRDPNLGKVVLYQLSYFRLFVGFIGDMRLQRYAFYLFIPKVLPVF